MTSQSLHHLSSALPALPAALVFSTQLLLTQKSSVARPARSDGSPPESYTFRATKLTAILKGIPGYNHDGLNE